MTTNHLKYLAGTPEHKAAIGIPGWAQQLIDGEGSDGYTVTKTFAHSPILYRAVQLRANAISCIPYVIRKGTIEVPWPFPQSLPTLLYEMESSLLLHGAAFVLKQIPNAGGTRTVGLQWLNPFSVQVRYINGVTYFEQFIQGRKYGPWTIDRLIYMREFSISDDVGPGLAPAAVALTAAGLRVNMNEFAAAFFHGGAQPMTLLTIEGNPAPTEVERTERFFKRTMTGVRNAFRVLALRHEVKVEAITPPLNSMAMPELGEHTLREIAAAFGIPLTLLESNAANYATANSETRNFYEQTITPRLMRFADAFNSQLLAPLGLTCEFMPEMLSIFQEDEAERSGSLLNLVQAGIPLSSAMEILGYDIELIDGIDEYPDTMQYTGSDDSNTRSVKKKRKLRRPHYGGKPTPLN